MNVQLTLYKAETVCYNVGIRTGSVTTKERGVTMEAKREHVYALGFCVLKGTTSVSMLQKMTNWRYSKASTAIDWMEKNRYISPFSDSAPRKIFISLKQYKLSFGEYLYQDRLFRKKYEKELLALLENQ